MAFPRDRTALKCFVFGVSIFEVVQTMLVASDAWNTLGRGWGQPAMLNRVHLSCVDVPFMSSISEFYSLTLSSYIL